MHYNRFISLFCFTSLSLVCTSCCQKETYCASPVIETTFTHKYGVELPSHEWEQRGKNGNICRTLKTGVVVNESFSEGQLHGLTTYTFPHSDLIEKTFTYDNGRLCEKASYSRAGSPLGRTDYDVNGSYTIAMWYENGSAKCRESYNSERKLISGEYFTTDHQLESSVVNGSGERPIRDDYGQLLWKENFEEGEANLRTTYHPNGIPKEVVEWRHNGPHGTTKRFLPSGEPSSVEMWKHGKKDGLTIEYRNGERYAEVPYYLDSKRGIERRYTDGKPVEEICWKDDVRHGPSYIYHNGNKMAEWYYQGMPVTKSAFNELSQKQ